jgi:hypothetical protein
MKKKEAEDKMLGELNDFMKRFSVEEITFGKRHKVVKTTTKKAKSKLLKK